MEIVNTESIEIENNDQIKTETCPQASKKNEIIIEEISRNHKLLRRHKISQQQVFIGRGYHNDIILSDSHICPSHLSIEQVNGQWEIKDHESVNGSFIENTNKKKHTANRHVINDGDVITLGKSQLRILFTDHPVAETLALSPFESLINLMRHPAVLLLSAVVFTLVAGSIFYLNTPKEVNFSQLLVPTIGMVLGFALWPAGVALVSHLSKNEARIMTQLGVSFAFFNLMWFTDLLDGIINFNSASGSIAPFFVTIISIALAFALFWLNAYIGFQMSVRRRFIVATSITVLLFGGGYLVQYSKKPEFNPRPQYDATIMMPSFIITPSASVDDFIEDSVKLFDKTKEEALKE